MADSEVLKKLKDIPFKIQTTSLKERRDVIDEIQDVLSTPGIAEPAVRFVCRTLALTLQRYRDSTSQAYIRSLVAYLAANHRESTLRSLLPVLQEISEQLRNTVTSDSTSHSGLYALRWSTVLVEGTLNTNEEDGLDYDALVLSQANLLAVVTAYGHKQKNEKAYSVLHKSWSSIGKEKLDKWLEVLVAQPADSGPHVSVAFSALCRHMKQVKAEQTITQHKPKMLENFTKSLISVKARPNSNYIKACSDFLQLLDKSEVQDTLVPALHKGMLRSPETITQAVGEVLANLKVYLDGVAVDIGKSLIGEIQGSGISILTHLAVSGEDRVALFNEATTQMSRVLESESHDRTLCVALDVLHSWLKIIDGPMPDKILDIFKKNLSAKSSSQAVRVAYTSMISRGLRHYTASSAQGDTLRPLLLKAVEKAAQQPLQHLVVSEGICAMLGLALLDTSRELPTKSQIWTALVHTDKHVLLHDRILTSAGDDEYPEEDCQRLAIDALRACHHPLAVAVNKRAWIKIVYYLKLEPKGLVASYAYNLNNEYITGYTPNDTLSNVVSTLVAVNSEVIAGNAIQCTLDTLLDADLLRVTRDEYFTYLTPEGELYDKSSVPGNEDSKEMNLKRESKAYSYKEQQEEQQLRRELEEKKRREGKVKELNSRVVIAVRLLEAVQRGSPLAISLAARHVVLALLAALRSPLAAPRLAPAHLDLRRALLPQYPSLGDTVARVTIRLHKPQCDLDPSWEEEDLERATVRVINLVHAATAAIKNDHEDDEKPKVNYFTAPGFCYVFPLLKQGMSFVICIYTSGRVQAACTVALLESANCAARGALTFDDVVCLLAGLQSPLEVVRDAALRALLCVVDCLPPLFMDPEYALILTKRLLIATFDISPDNKKLAEELWSKLPQAQKLSQDQQLVELLLDEVQHPAEEVQKAAAAALAHLVDASPEPVHYVLERLQEIYSNKLPLIPARLDQFGHVVEEAIDEWGARRGVALALCALAPKLQSAAVPLAMRFFVERGLADRSDKVRPEMLNAAMAIVELHGKETLSSQLPVFENFLDKAPKSGGYDAVRECVVLLVGSLARHLDSHDNRIKPITLRLVAALSTPSQQVQEAVSNCLPHLVSSPALEDEIPAIMNKLMKQLLTAEKYGDRKGAAYGIAGIIKGLGILSLKQLDVMGKLTEAIQEKKNFKYREGALFGFEMLCHKLGRLFEPYIVHVLPHLLLCFGDSSQYVRAAADDTAKLIMSKLSAHGVKLVLPSLLQALQDDNWRTKAGSIELLGAMAYCAPKQLSSCLPSIVPKLIEVLSDSHMRVQDAGAEALKVIGSVIRNPEIQAIVPVLLQALQDPSNKTSACLQTLLDTKFVHFIDAPSLALIMPVVQRAFLDRSTETRKMAAQIIGNMYSLTDQKDLMPYLPNIIPGLKSSLLDPVPEVRSVSARALGAMVKGMGESSFEELLPWLMQTLTSESSSVDRSGAAQGLSEVVAGLGVHKLHKIMPDIIATAERTDIAPHVKDGYIMMFIYMPGAFTDEFTPYIGQIINPILKALADENEYVRETALKAGQRIVNLYAETAITLLLPELERGLFDDNWRIRYSSVQLLGDLLYRISGVSGKMSTETASEDDNFGTEHSHKAIMNALGMERRNRVLAGLYMGRSDVALMVRQAALHVWKVVVTNTPKTLREILPTLFGLLLGCLASTSYDKRQVAARTLGDLVRKLGERVLPEIVPILERGLRSERADQRQGVCIGLGEILASTSRDAVLSFADGLVPTVRTALCDPLPEVRLAAARTFDSLHATIGNKALDDILPPMLEQLKDPDPALADATLDGLKQIMAIKSRAVLPYLVPVLTGGGGGVDTRALSALAAAAGPALGRHLPRVLPALLNALVAARQTPDEPKELEHCRDALLPVSDPAGVRWYASLIYVLLMAWEALSALTRTLDPERQIQHVSDVRQAVRYAAADLKGDLLPGFCLPKGIAPILPLFRESILNGLPEDKENAALMLGEVIKLTSPAAIQPSVVHITGPLIRILGDRFNSSVKAAVLETLASLLSKVGVMLKQFLPQLQTTFLKALNDGSRAVRMKAGLALSRLVAIHSRADPLFVEMHNGVRNADDPAIRETMLQALRSIITVGGDKMSEQLALNILTTLTSPALLAHPEDPPRSAVGGCLGALLHCLPPTHRDAALSHHLLAANAPNHDDWLLQHGRSCALFVALKETPQQVYRESYEEKVEKTLLGYLASDKIPIVCNGIRGISYLMRYLLQNDKPVPQNILSQFVRVMFHYTTVHHVCYSPRSILGRLCSFFSFTISQLVGVGTICLFLPHSSILTYLFCHTAYHHQCMSLLEEGGRESLGDVVARLQRRAHTDGRDEDLDCTLIT
ncbi:hypothetical protein K1T71_003624 [Dendrolimus kikuchii]|uniref:Uncharacterized protein n=1 Tax=Dendrolimus kikuchii TaxID=765133 RepID=A0ACC1D8P3_9NEOP|nr:hypothetical protein K1T71_003624 [Dendrolimus kikuchii]